MEWKKVIGPAGAALVGLLLVCMAAMPVSAEEGPVVEVIDGGSLLIDENGGLHCTALAGTFFRPSPPAATYQVVVHYEYRDSNDVIGQTATFRLKGPDGTVVEQSVPDIPLLNSNRKGTLSVNITPADPGEYHWDIECSEGADSASSRGDLIFR
ncbi:hypothetical protein [Methanofollis sp. UBA420]|jgi:hypothetical protein|uniref:hypothetical protein n=1 Tax=Methanofollis sp. UBA420 TaxID=1915514 RepID=UPI00316AECE9